MMEFRQYQQAAHINLRKSVAAGNRKILLQAATGSGKTVIAAKLIHAAEERDRQVLFFAHRRELVYQAADKLEDFGVRHGYIMSGEEMWSNDIRVCSVDTFRARAMRGRIGWPGAHLVVIDEAHRSLSPTYQKIIEHYYQQGAVILGLSATPIRGDGKGLGDIYEDMVCCPGIGELIARGYLVKPVHYAPSLPDLTGVRTGKAGDYDAGQLEGVMDKAELVGDVVTNWLRLSSDRPTIVFASGVKHSIHLRDEFKRAGIQAAHVDGTTPDDERDRIVKDLHEGRLQVVTNCMVFTEGFDCPPLSTVVLARPTKNYGLYLQMAGRGLRTHEGKDHCRIIDHSGAVYRHGKVDDPHEWRLEESAISEKESKKRQTVREKTTITCVKCGAVYSGQINCPMCNHVPERKGRYVVSRTGDLVAVEDATTPADPIHWERHEKVRFFNRLLVYAKHKKYKRNWAHYKFREKFKHWPDKDYPELELPPEVALEDKEFMAYIRSLNIKAGYRKRKQQEEAEKARADIHG